MPIEEKLLPDFGKTFVTRVLEEFKEIGSSLLFMQSRQFTEEVFVIWDDPRGFCVTIDRDLEQIAVLNSEGTSEYGHWYEPKQRAEEALKQLRSGIAKGV